MPAIHACRLKGLGASALLGLLIAGAIPANQARAADDCGAPVANQVTCNLANETSAGAYQDADGVTYDDAGLTIIHPGDGVAPTEFIKSGLGNGSGNLVVNSSGAVLQTSLSTANTSGGIYVTTDGTIDITTTAAGTVTTNGTDIVGIYAVGTGTGAITITAAGKVTTTTGSAAGIYATSAGGPITIQGGAVETTGTGASYGLGAFSSGTGVNGIVSVTATGAVSTAGTNGYGLYGSTYGDSVTLDSQAVSTTGSFASGLFVTNVSADAGKSASATAHGTVTTTGDNSWGLFGNSLNGTVTLVSEAISTQGVGAYGLNAQSSGTAANSALSVTAHGAIVTTGKMAHGVMTSSAGTMDIDVTDVTASGQDSWGVRGLSSASGVTIDVTNVQGGWNGGVGVYYGSSASGVDSTFTLRSGGSLGALSDLAIIASNGDELAIIGGRAVGQARFDEGDDELRIVSGGRWDLRAYYDTDGDGDRDAQGDASLDFGVGNDKLSIEAGGVLALATVGETNSGAVSVTTFNNAGLITLSDTETGQDVPLTGDRLLITGAYSSVGTGGSLHLDARLDAGGPGSGPYTDRLLIQGSVTGVTLVTVANAEGGPGDETGSGNTAGISIIQVSGSAATDSFQLTGPVVAGAYQYSLVAFDPSTSSPIEMDSRLTAGDFWDYRLQSTFFGGTVDYAGLPQGASMLGQSALNAALSRPAEPPAIAAPNQSAALGLGDLQEAVRPTAGGGVATGAWLAGFGEGLSVTPDGGADFEQDNYGLQAGYDLFGWRGLFGGDDSMTLGVMGTMAQGDLDFSASDTDMTVNLYGGGVYAGFASGGLQVNAVAQLLFGTADITAPMSGVDTEIDVTTLGLGLGVAHRFEFGALFLEPGADLRYVRAWTSDSFQDASNADISLDDTDSLIAQSHLKAGISFESVAPYLRVGVVHEFLGDSSASVDGLGFDTSTEGTTFEVGGGITAWALASNITLQVDAAYRFGDTVEGASVTGGIKFSW